MKKIFDYFKQHKISGIVLLVIIVGGGYYWYHKAHSSSDPVKYVTQAAQVETISSTVTGTGQVQASNQIDIKPQTDGRLTTVNIQQNQQVKANDILAVIDQQTAANSLAQARANLEQTQASYDKLVAGATQNAIQTQQLSIQSAQNALDQAKTSYNNTVTTQQQAVDKALTSLLNTDLTAEPSDTLSTATLTISGNYTGKDKGAYAITLYSGEGGSYYSSAGLGDQNQPVNRGMIQPLGNGLYVTFGASGTLSQSTVWTISLPNTKSSSYLADSNAYNSALQTQQQALDSAQNSITAAQNALDKANLSMDNIMTPPTASDLASAKAQITSAQAQLQNAQTAYSNTVLRAPFDGVVAAVDFAAGDKVTAGTTVATIITKQQVAKISLNEVDVAKIKLGQNATLTFDAVDGLEMTGKVAQIDTLGTASQGVVSYGVKIALDTQDDRIKPGMSVSASIITDVRADVLAVPNSAIKSNNNGSYVQILDSKGQPQNVTVTTGLANDTSTEILSGLKEGDQVVTQTITSSASKTTTAGTTGSLIPGIGGGGAVRVNVGGGGANFRGN
jgi:HlyD family secretion protein